MRRHTHIQRDHIQFTHWSRAGWAVFRSLGRIVNIGHVDMGIQEQSLMKSSCSNNLSLLSDSSDKNTTEKTEPSESSFADLIPALMMLLALLLSSQTDISYSGSSPIFHFDTIKTIITTGGIWILFPTILLYTVFFIYSFDKSCGLLSKAWACNNLRNPASFIKQHYYDSGY
ncbi:MAG: hypothetical protein JEZ03_01165 [Bacteroidales bacterium]|nr:hypothetical protein [Bacteroidales bacterium]